MATELNILLRYETVIQKEFLREIDQVQISPGPYRLFHIQVLITLLSYRRKLNQNDVTFYVVQTLVAFFFENQTLWPT